MQLFTNNARSTLATGISNSATSLTVATGEGAMFPALSGSDFFMLTLLTSSGGVESNIEIVMVTARSADNMTIARAQEGTAAVVHASGSVVSLRDTAKFFNDVGTALAAKEVSANKDASGGYAGRTLYKLNLPNDANTFTSTLSNIATAVRSWVMPDKNGTVAMTSDITGTNSGTNTGDQTITLTGDVTGGGTGSFVATIANNAITLGKMATMATASLLGRNTAGTGNPEVLSAATAKGLLALNNVDNTSDANKPVSSAQSAAIALKQDTSAKDASNGYAGLTLYKLNMKDTSGTYISFFTNTNTAARTYTLPDKDGTVAMLSDVTSAAAAAFVRATLMLTAGTFITKVAGPHIVYLVGPGGSGAIVNNSSSSGVTISATGGAAGGLAIKNFSAASAGISYTFTQGAPGTAPTGNTANGNAGGTSTFIGTGVSVTANGGAGGTYSQSTPVLLAGAIGGTASGGDINLQGGNSGSCAANAQTGSATNTQATGGAAVAWRGSAFNSGNVACNSGTTATAVASGGAGVGGNSGTVTYAGGNATSGGGGTNGASANVTTAGAGTVGAGSTGLNLTPINTIGDGSGAGTGAGGGSPGSTGTSNTASGNLGGTGGIACSTPGSSIVGAVPGWGAGSGGMACNGLAAIPGLAGGISVAIILY